MAALLLTLGACGQKGPLYLPAQDGIAARPAAKSPSAAASPTQGASTPAAAK